MRLRPRHSNFGRLLRGWRVTFAALKPSGGRQRVIAALGIVQILAWGSSYYLLAVLAEPITRDTGWPYPWVIGGISLGLLVSGLIATHVGRAINSHGGRPVLAIGALLFAAGLSLIAAAPVLADLPHGLACARRGNGRLPL